MKYQTSYRTRRIVGQLEPGVELIDALTDLCREELVEAGQIRISGGLDHVELTHFDPASRTYRVAHSGGPAEIGSLTGTIATIGGQIILRLDALLLGQSSFGAHLVTGQVSSAKVSAVEFVIEVFDDLEIVRGKDATTGRMTISKIKGPDQAPAPAAQQATMTPAKAPEQRPASPTAPTLEPAPPVIEKPQPKPSPKPSATVGSSMSWGEAIEKSEKAPATSRRTRPAHKPTPEPDANEIYADVDDMDEEDERPLMKSGDFLDHPKLGRCRIMKVEDDEDFAHVRLPRGKIRKLVLEIFEIHYKGKEDGRDVFSLRIAK